MEPTANFIIHKEALPFLNASLFLNNIKFVHSLSIENAQDKNSNPVEVRITSDIPCIEPFTYVVSSIPTQKLIKIPLENLKIKRDFLNTLSETEKANIKIELFEQNNILASESIIIKVHPLEYFDGFQVLPHLIASFVTPNHPYIYYLKRKAIEILEEQRLKTAFEGYQSGNPERVLQIMSAFYTAIQSEHIIYSALPPGYEETGQRIRLLNTIQKEKFGNCIDMSLLFAACLEAVDLHPILIILRGHAFVGCWLYDQKFHEIINEDKTAITKRISKGIREIAAIEATSICKGNNINFSDALNMAEAQLVEKEEFLLSVDIKSARIAFVRPLPLSTETGEMKLDKEAVIKESEIKMENQFNIGNIYQAELINNNAKSKTKQKIWERKLLDLSLRNNLLNLRITRNMLQLIDIDICSLEDILSDGKSFALLPHPNAEILGRYNLFSAPLHPSSPMFQKANDDLKYNRLLTYYHQKDLDQILTYIHKNAKQSIEENGSSTLYLAVGLLQWYDRKMPDQQRHAPILLLPVEINRRSVNSKFTLRSREEETMINITLLEFLRQEYEMNLSGLELLPQDDKGVDVPKVMAILRRAIMQLPGWDIKEQLVLGNFSFSKLILWNDIVVHQEQLLKNDMVRSLVEGKLNFYEDHEIPSDDIDSLESSRLTLPISTDVSQMEAVLAAQKGQSFILHGPPGTGKSQTITNIIADALYQGKRVLFVAAKKAALDVVHRRLEQIGLGPFTLELHSNKSKKSDVLVQLSQSLEVSKQVLSDNYQKESQRLDAAQKAISQYINLLHKNQPVGWSLYDSITALENFENANFSKNFIPEAVLQQLNPSIWQQWTDWLLPFQAVIQIIIHPSENPLAALQIKQYSVGINEAIHAQINELLKRLPQLRGQLKDITNSIHFPFPVSSRKELENFIEAIDIIENLDNIALSFSAYLSEKENQLLLDEWMKYFQQYQEALKNILTQCNHSILDVDIPAIEVQWRQAQQSWFLPKWLKKKRLRKLLNAHRTDILKIDSETEQFFVCHRQLQEASRLLKQSRFIHLENALKHLYKNEQTNIADIEMKSNAIKLLGNSMEIWGVHSLRTWMKILVAKQIEYSDEIKNNHAPAFGNFRLAVASFWEQEKNFSSLSGFKFPNDKNWLDDSINQLQKIQSHLQELKSWMNYQQICERGNMMSLQWFIIAYESKDFIPENVSDYFYYIAHSSIARDVISKHESLSLFNAGLFESKIEHYRQIAVEYKALTIRQLYTKLSAHIPNTAKEAMQSSEPGILQRAIRNKGRGISIRKLFDQIPNLLPRLAPCMLMSPISVAQYFDVNTDHFDLLIFDEASQLPTCEAVSALARARQAIIVGDPKQMPPTSFFSTTKLDEENMDIEDLESILDDCLSLSLPSKYLLRHYRSKHESLIAFSNANFYENKLLTFPSANDLERKVQYHYVPGFYDKGKTRTNKFEADTIIQFVQRHYNDPQKRKFSLGIVTFSQIQQNLIEEKLIQLFSLNPELEELANECDEPIFIKNLENVQGDERDIILFSIGYAPDESGKMSMNFGPLNRNGGWRRLNVAVTRARYEMHVFATLKAELIDLGRTSAEGVAGLKAFLNFAEKGQLIVQAEHIEDHHRKQQLSESISKCLKKKGLKVQCNIGSSEYKVDIGIVHPEKPQEFILGIVIDGYYYYKSRTTNDRELVMPSVLKSLGWNIYRIWSLDWYENSSEIIETIVEKVIQLKETPAIETNEIMPSQQIVPQIFDPIKSIPATMNAANPACRQRPYVTHALALIPHANGEIIFEFKNRQIIIQQIQNVINAEAPISKSLLFKRVLQAWNISRVGARLDKYLGDIVQEMRISYCLHHQPFYLKTENSIPLCFYRNNDIEKRKIEDIAPEEIIVALEECVINNLSIEEDELLRYLSRLFGFSKVGRQIEVQMKYAIGLAVKQERIKREGNRIKVMN